MRQRRWLELVKDYNYDIRYHMGKANVVANTLSKIVMLSQNIGYQELQQELMNDQIELAYGLLVRLRIQFTLLDKILVAQLYDNQCNQIKQKVIKGTKLEINIANNVLRFKGQAYVPSVVEFRNKILVEDYSSFYTTLPRNVKMCQNLEKSFLWFDMKKDVADFVVKCLVCQQAKTKHHWPLGFLHL